MCQSSRSFKAEHSILLCFLASSVNIILAFSLVPVSLFGAFPKPENWFVMTPVSHSLFPLISDRGCTKRKKKKKFWEK